jgi:adenylate cyclase
MREGIVWTVVIALRTLPSNSILAVVFLLYSQELPVTIEHQRDGYSPDWPTQLRRDLFPLAQAIHELVEAVVLQACGGSQSLRADAGRLGRASADLVKSTHHLAEMGQVAEERKTLVRQTRHDLFNLVNHLSGYSQFLLEVDEDTALGICRNNLQRIGDLGQECTRIILQHLPRERPQETMVAAVPGSTREQESFAVPSNILVVDDDEQNRQRLVRALRAQGHVAHEARDGQEAIERLQQGVFDLVLLDISMPRMDGYEVLRWIRSDRRRGRLPVLMVSGLDEHTHTSRCIEAGAEDFLPKPVDHLLLRARVNSLLAKRRQWVRELEQFFPPEVAHQFIDRPEALQEGTTTDLTVLFCDVRGYSRISQILGPGACVEWISAVMEELTDCILSNGGVLVDFIGDEALAMWGAPTHQPDHAVLACRTALEMFSRLPKLNAAWQERLGEAMEFSIGVHSGSAWVGNSGTRRKFKYGPSGETVNLGSRVQGSTKFLKASLIVTRGTHERLQGSFCSRRLGRVHVVNIVQPVELYEVVPDGIPNWPELKRLYEEALSLYEDRQLKAAAQLLGSLIAAHGATGPPLTLMARTIEGLMYPDRWAAVFQLPGK